jgi:ribose/xylose/arabinose/galactoside ABC-type transport system permease subunit
VIQAAWLQKQWFVLGGWRLRGHDLALICLLGAVVLAGTLTAESFYTERNLSNLLRQIVANGLVSLGMLLVILTGGIDLSVGSIVALGGVLFAGMTDQIGLGPALAVAMAAGFTAGLLNGVVIVRFKLQPFIVTLATMGIFRGCVYIYTETPIVPAHAGFRDLGATLMGPVSVGVIIMMTCYVLVWFFLNQTPVGRATVAIGGNEEAVRLAGVNVAGTVVLAYALSGLLAALSGAILVSRLGIAQPSLGIAYELDAIAAAVIGGAVLGGGGGGAIGTFFGVLTLGLINNLLNLHGVKSFYQEIVKGSLIIFAVLAASRKMR